MSIRNKWICAFAAALLAVFPSCSTEVQSAFDPWAVTWSEVEQLFASGELDETLRRIEKLLQAPEPYRSKAAAWKMVILAGKARGYFELAEAYLQGARENPGQSSLFWRATGTYRSRCRAESLALAEMALAADRYFGPSDAVELDFPAPAAGTGRSPLVSSAALGRPIPEAQIEAVVSYTLRRGVALTICEAASATLAWTDSAEPCGEQRPVVPKPRLLAMFGKVLYEQAELFTKERLDDREKHALLLDLSENLLRATLADHQQQNARLEAWRVELANRRSEY